MKKLFTLLSIAFCLNTNAQITFQKKITNVNLRSLLQINNGSYLLAGANNAYGGFCFIKTNTIGDTLWTKTYNTTTAGNNLVETAINKTNDGGYIITGYVDSTGVGTLNTMYLIKTDSLGNIMWTKSYKNAQGFCVQQTIDGGYIIGGNTNTYGAGNYDMYLVKTDSLGTILWTKTYGTPITEYINSLQQTADGGYIINGSSSNTNTATYLSFLIKTNPQGNTTWVKTYYIFPSNMYPLVGGTCYQSPDGGYIMSGASTATYGSYVFYIKLNATGNVVWAKSQSDFCTGCSIGINITGLQPTNDNGCIFFTSLDEIIFGSSTTKSSAIYKVDSTGLTQWTTLNDSSIQNNYAIQQTADSGYAILQKNINYFFTKINKNGNTNCANSSLSNMDNSNTIIAVDTSVIVSSGSALANVIIHAVSYAITNTTTCAATVGINKFSKSSSINIYPNPAQNNFTIETNEKQTISMFDINGKLILLQIITGTTNIDASNFNAGVYNISITNNTSVINKRLVIVK